MIFDTDKDQIGIAFHNITRSKYMRGPAYLPKKVDPVKPAPSDDLQTTLIIVIVVLAVLIAIILSKILIINKSSL